MGSEVVRAIGAAEGMKVVAAVDPAHEDDIVSCGSDPDLVCTADLAAAIEETSPDVMVDFTHPSVVGDNLRIALSSGLDCLVGTTGLPPDTLERLVALSPEGTCLFVAPNFAIGAVLMMRFAEQAARFMPSVEIIELHHDRKADAPSGTALRTAALVNAARSSVPATPGSETELPGGEGARGACVDDVHIHSVRLPGLVAHQEVIFGGQGQTLSIRHDSIDRTSFMPGVVLAVREVGARSGLVVGLEKLLGV